MNTEGWAFFAWARVWYPDYSRMIVRPEPGHINVINFFLWDQWRVNR